MAQISYGTITITDTTDLEWFYGTDLTHTSGTAVANITGAAVGSMYLNTQTSLAYKCTAVAANGDQTWQYVGNMASGALEAVQEAVDNIKIGGRNLILNTNVPDVSSAAKRPRLVGQTINTVCNGTAYVVEHGFGDRSNATNHYRPLVRFGSNSVSSGSMNGLVAGKTYTLSFDCHWQGYSNAAQDSTTKIRVYLFDNRDAEQTFTGTTLATIATVSPGVEGRARCEVVFTLPDNITMLYINVAMADSTASNYLEGDYIELANLKLEEGNKATNWTPAPEDITNNIDDITNIINNISVGENLLLDSDAPSLTKVVAGSDRYWSSNASLASHGTAKFVEILDSPCRAKNGIELECTTTATVTHGLAFYNSPNTSKLSFINGQTYTMSCYVKVVSGTVDQCQFNIQNGSSMGYSTYRFTPTSEWKRYSKTFTATSDLSQKVVYFEMAYASIGAVQMCGFKLEKGNMATAWSDTINVVEKTHRIYYRKSASGAPALPSSWVTANTDVFNDWTTKVPRLTENADGTGTKYLFLYTCEQSVMSNKELRYTDVLLDDSTTVIDGGNIITGTVTANQLNADNINANKILTIGAFQEGTQENILNSNVQIGGRNLIYNTLVPNVTSNDTRPNIGGDGTNGYAYGASTGELTTATHGVRHTVTSTSRPGICFGPNNVNIGLHGLETGKMYTWSFDWTAQIFSGSPPTGTSYYLRATLGYVPAGSSSYNTSTYENIHIYRASDPDDERGNEISGRGEFTFELPAGATAMRLYITTNSTTASYYQAGDFLELRNIKLEVGNKATDWTPAPEDVDLSISEVDSKTNEAASKVEQVSNTLSSTNTTIQQQGTAIQALQKITAPITLDVRDENNPAIVIQAGVSQSEQDNNTVYSRLILSKERISFHKVYDADGDSSTDDDQIDTEVLFIDSTEKQGVIDINNARIQQSIKIGNLEIIAYQGGIAVRRS